MNFVFWTLYISVSLLLILFLTRLLESKFKKAIGGTLRKKLDGTSETLFFSLFKTSFNLWARDISFISRIVNRIFEKVSEIHLKVSSLIEKIFIMIRRGKRMNGGYSSGERNSDFLKNIEEHKNNLKR